MPIVAVRTAKPATGIPMQMHASFGVSVWVTLCLPNHFTIWTPGPESYAAAWAAAIRTYVAGLSTGLSDNFHAVRNADHRHPT